MKPIIIIGAGLAGYTVARELRKLDQHAPLMIITEDDGSFYSKPMLSNAFAQKKTAAQLITQSAAQMAAQLNAEIVTRTSVLRIDSAGKVIDTSVGQFTYGKLVLAIGAQPIRLSIGGDAADQVLSVNHLSDYAIFRARLKPEQPSRVAILGAGLIGCEFADDLTVAGHAVTLIDPNSLPMSPLSAPTLSRGLQAALLDRGIVLHLGATANSIDRRETGLAITLSNNTVFEADIVLSAVGMRPHLTLAQVARLETGRGILVDRFGKTSAVDVYALGDCAEYTMEDGRTGILPYIAPLMTAARAIARTLTDTPTAIDLKPTPVIVKTPSFPLALLPPPQHMKSNGDWRIESQNQRTICRFYDRDGVMSGFGVSPHEAAVRQALMAELGKIPEAKAVDAGG